MMRSAVALGLGLIALGALAVALWAYTPDEPRAVIAAKYKVGAADYLEVAGLRLHLRDSGPRSAPALILLHGFGSSLETWDAWADALSTDFRVIRFDMPGCGLSSLDPAGDYSGTRSRVVIAAVMDRLGLAKASLIGNSMGGRFAWSFAAHAPARVERLVLISPDGFASAGFAYGKAPTVPLGLRLLPYVLPRALVRMSLAPAYGDPERLRDATVERYRDFMLAPGVRGAMIARMAQTVLDRPEPLLARITAPTLILWGERDRMIPLANAKDYVASIPHALLVTLPGLGHVPFEEAPAASLPPVLAFLRAAR